ncbi:DUF2490 domain-containing protein [Halosquirtibacter xylanolyticus]|uniref:DUF2490 domain-containing protein n=1 Tax=Halosquirtibacter xylanolyticus TaxID=3374599 RepID=UPI003748D9D3|nr:DUF2490 domain-containing protein [Prolixibacteraceae bacterium]
MKNIFQKKWLYIFCILCSTYSFSNRSYAIDNYNQFRTYYFLSTPIKPNWNYVGALGYHYVTNNDNWNRIELRNELSYRFKRDIKFTAGARLNYVRKYHQNYQFEVRPYQAVSLTWPRLNSFNFVHRLMMEERFTWDLTGENEMFAQGRFRYRVDTKIPISKPALIPKSIYIRPMFETFISFGDNIDHAYFSQNKYTVAPGYIISNNLTLEFRYELINGKSATEHITNKKTNLFRLQLTHKLF